MILDRLTPEEHDIWESGEWVGDHGPRCDLCGCLLDNHRTDGTCGVCSCEGDE